MATRLGRPRITRTYSPFLDPPTATLIKRAAMAFGSGAQASLGTDMESVRKSLWFMEGRFGGEVSLDELSQAAGISRYHFAHVFARATGQSAMRYMRGRRLSEAARVLANGGPDILSVALDFGYGSHEAFTRAFRDQFGLTPESIRAQRHLDNVILVEAIKMDDGLITTLAPPRIEQGRLLLIAGLGGKYSSDTHQNIPALWQRFQPDLGNVPGQVFAGGGGKGGRTFGVCYRCALPRMLRRGIRRENRHGRLPNMDTDQDLTSHSRELPLCRRKRLIGI
jgi:AraC-like DNA-binding protein